MGADVDVKGGYIHAKAKGGRLTGTTVHMGYSSRCSTMKHHAGGYHPGRGA